MPKLSKKEKQRLKQEQELKMKQDKLDRELGYTKEQMSEIRRKVFEQAKLINLPIVKEEWLHKWSYFERTIDWKDFYISQLRDDIYYYELHARLTEQKHNENIDRLLELYNDGIDKVMDVYQVERNKLLKEKMREENRIVLTQQRRIENMESIIHNLLEEREEELKVINWDNINEKQLKVFRFENAFSRLAQEGDEVMHETWTKLKGVFDKYKVSTSKKRREYLILKQRDVAEKAVLDNLTKRMAQLHTIIKKYKGKLNKMKIDEIMKNELEMRKALFERMKREMKFNSDETEKNLKTLTSTSNIILRRLNDLVSKLMNAITLVGTCRKLETIEEKASPKLYINAPLNLFKNSEVLPLLNDMEMLWAKIDRVNKMNKNMSLKLQEHKNENIKLNEKLRCFIDLTSRPGNRLM